MTSKPFRPAPQTSEENEESGWLARLLNERGRFLIAGGCTIIAAVVYYFHINRQECYRDADRLSSRIPAVAREVTFRLEKLRDAVRTATTGNDLRVTNYIAPSASSGHSGFKDQGLLELLDELIGLEFKVEHYDQPRVGKAASAIVELERLLREPISQYTASRYHLFQRQIDPPIQRLYDLASGDSYVIPEPLCTLRPILWRVVSGHQETLLKLQGVEMETFEPVR